MNTKNNTASLNKIQRIERIFTKRERIIRDARKSFYSFCQALAHDYYIEIRLYLKELCNILQALYQGELLNTAGNIYKKLIINIPPQHGKTRTLILFCMWVYGQNIHERIIACSYNDLMAMEFSRYTRDGIDEEKNNELDIVYSDIFPEVTIKQGDSSYGKWALEGEHFSYKGAGIGGAITGKGGTIRIIDDPVKNDREAYNETVLINIYKWFVNTFLSRASGTPIDIINMTRWSKKDLVGIIRDDEDEKDEWYIFEKEAYNENIDKMLCEDFLPKKRYFRLRRLMDDAIFLANYHQSPIDIKGRLYSELKLYEDQPEFEDKISYTDTADKGTNYLCNWIAGLYKHDLYIIDALYTNKSMDITEYQTAELLYNNKVNTARIESNSGGRGFARNVERILNEKFDNNRIIIEWFHQSQNKEARILSAASFVINRVFFPMNFKSKHSLLYKHLIEYEKNKKNKYDDAQDALTGLVEMIDQDIETESEISTGGSYLTK